MVGSKFGSGAVAVCLALLALVVPGARAAFPGRNGMLAVQPVSGRGIVLVSSAGRHQHRICTAVRVCGTPRVPRWSPDGRALVFTGPRIRVIYADGSCLNCQFGSSSTAAFEPDGVSVSFGLDSSQIAVDWVDGLRQTAPWQVTGSDAVWAATGEVAVVRHGAVWAGQPAHLRSIALGVSPSWSPNARRLAVARGGWIWLVDLRTGDRRRLVRGSAPAFSPDGHRIAFIGRDKAVFTIGTGLVPGRPRMVGQVRGVSVDWQPRPSVRRAGCVAPPGTVSIASSPGAVLTSHAGPSAGPTAFMGCLRRTGEERYLLRLPSGGLIEPYTQLTVSAAAVAAPFAVLAEGNEDLHYGDFTATVHGFDLRTGAPDPHVGGETVNCGGASFFCSAVIDQIVLGSDGVSAAHVDPDPTAGGPSVGLNVACPLTTFCVGRDDFGNKLIATTPTAATPWTPTTTTVPTTGVCPSSTLCVGVEGQTVYTTGNPAGAAPWTATQLPGSVVNLNAIACPSTTLCVAVTALGGVAVSTDPGSASPTWTIGNIDGPYTLNAISCPSTTFCAASDSRGDVLTSRNPAAAASAWSTQPVSPNAGVDDIQCPAPSLCLAVKTVSTASPVPGIYESTTPAAGPWTLTATGDRPVSLSCPSVSLCVAAGFTTTPPTAGTIDTTTDPQSEVWTQRTYTRFGDLESVQCPSTALCVAAGSSDGSILFTTQPGATTSAWSSVLADRITCTQPDFPCGSEEILASDRHGPRQIDANIEFEPQTGRQLTHLTLAGDTVNWDHLGSARSTRLTP